MASLTQSATASIPSSSSGASDPFGNDDEVQGTGSTKIDRIRVYLCLEGLSSESPTAEGNSPTRMEGEQEAQVCLDLVVRTKSPSPNAFRFRSGWLSHSTVSGVKKILFEEVSDLLDNTKLKASTLASSPSNAKSQKLMGFTTFKGSKWRDISDLDPVGEPKAKASSSGVVSSLRLPLTTSAPKNPITSDCKLAITFVPNSSTSTEALVAHTRDIVQVKGREFFFFQVMLDKMVLAREDEEGLGSPSIGGGGDELLNDKMRKAASASDSGGSDSEEIDDAESTNLSLRETLRQRATGFGGFRASSFSFDEATDSDDDDADEVMWLDDEQQR